MHDICMQEPGKATDSFTLKTVHCVVAKSKDDSNAIANQMNGGTKLATLLWNTKYTAVIWVTKWAPQGLMPVRPIVCFTSNVDIPAGHALKLSHE